jgi:hypothetical protein
MRLVISLMRLFWHLHNFTRTRAGGVHTLLRQYITSFGQVSACGEHFGFRESFRGHSARIDA